MMEGEEVSEVYININFCDEKNSFAHFCREHLTLYPQPYPQPYAQPRAQSRANKKIQKGHAMCAHKIGQI